MACIVPNILSLTQHLKTLKENSEKYKIEKCPTCGQCRLWHHGARYRKSDRENDAQSTLNPVPILRLYCPMCHRTCSVLPECIPPHRWYLWAMQCAAILLVFSGESIHKVSQKIIPSRWTIRRWVLRLLDQFNIHALHLKTTWSWLGYQTDLREFWLTLVDKIPFSTAMLVLNNHDVVVP